ncbi:putative transcriptional regulator [Cytobacillus horneckiae]|uniref:helix-turn-helix transcriptional regulator n=1 Tax=Cytobacillus horneckiae TaxID=549687 RepID=UPI0019D26D0C|nr:helix-turn-helix transcriptional regulator [Cytobacillus horneckiae]MBN6889939.1 helix-turn-helix transcriptional regulator [Cytobacillus horneckiae]
MERREKLASIRKNMNLTQRDVVGLLNEIHNISITESYYGMIEQGVRTPTLKIALAIANLFKSSPNDIFFNNKPNKKLGKTSA